MKLHNRWFQLFASLIAMIMIANLQYAWTLFVKPLQTGTGWKLSEIQAAFSLFIIFQTWVQPLDGWLIDRLGPRGFISAAGLLCGVGWAGMGYATTLPSLYALYCTAGIGAAFVYSGSIGSALKWFKERRGLASGIMAAGFGGGTALFIPIIQKTIGTRGYQTAFIATGIFQGLVILIVAQFLRHPPTDAEPAAGLDARRAGGLPASVKPQFTTLEMLRTPQFYSMYAAFVLMATGFLLVTANTGPIVTSWGFTAGALTLAATLSPVANGVSRIFWGAVSDRIGRQAAMLTAFVLNAASLFSVFVLGQLSGGWFAFTLVLVFFTGGQIYSLFPAMTADYFGTRHATSNYAVLYTAKGVASIIGGWLASLLFEQFGTWSIAINGSALMALVAAGLALGFSASSAPAIARSRPASVPAPAK
jgi:OFA family oxalate/formate antiporter-like MFS transporter